MKFVRFRHMDMVSFGRLDGGTVIPITSAPWLHWADCGQGIPLPEVQILAPVEGPRIFGFAYNYADHAAETAKPMPARPVVFMKPSTAVCGPNDPIRFASTSDNVHFEGELAAIIGKTARNVSMDNALDHVLGYTCANDVSDRVIQREESSYGVLLVGKGMDTFCPIGPMIVTDIDPTRLGLRTLLNGEVRQDASTHDLHVSVAGQIAYLSAYMTLLPGDVILTGTPAGVGPMKDGDLVEVEIEGIGTLANTVSTF